MVIPSSAGDGGMKRGKILRLKTGYNPNSSSVGSELGQFLWFTLGSGAVAVLASAVVDAILQKFVKTPAGTEPPKPPEPPA